MYKGVLWFVVEFKPQNPKPQKICILCNLIEASAQQIIFYRV